MSTQQAEYSNQHHSKKQTFSGAGLFLLLAVLAIGAFLLWNYGVIQPKPKLALVTSGTGAYWDLVIAGANEAAKVYDVDLNVIRQETDEAKQTETIRGLMGKGYSGVAISPINPVTQGPVLSELATHSPLVTVDSDSPVSMKICFVGTDNYYSGQMAAQHVRAAIPDGGDVIIVMGKLDKENTMHRRQGIIDALLDREDAPDRPFDPILAPLKGDKYSVVATLHTSDATSSAPGEQQTKELVAQALKDHPNVKCFVGLLSFSAPATLEALQAAGKLGQVKVVGFDALPATLDGVDAGNVQATILQDQYGFGYQAVRILSEYARGNKSGLPVFQQRTLPCESITNENVASIRDQLGKMATGAVSKAGQ